MTFAEEDLTRDAFLGGRVMLRQPRQGFRAATDAVFLAAAVDAQPGARVLDVGCGAGAAMACLSARLGGLDLHGLEIQPAYAALARRNLANATIWEGDVFAPPAGFNEIGFDWVLANPPFFDETALPSPNAGRDAARRETAGVSEWTRACLRRLRSGGRIAMIQRAEKLPAILAGLAGAGDIAVRPLQARAGRAAKRIVVTARKGAKGVFVLKPPLIIHAGDRHESDADDFTPEAEAILRDGRAL